MALGNGQTIPRPLRITSGAFKAKRKEDALELASLLYDIYLEQK
jgi:hypothetical protein